MPERPVPVSTQCYDQLESQVFASRQAMGLAAAMDVADCLRQLLTRQARVRMVFAAAASQNEFLAALAAMPAIDWLRVTAFHMDEYMGLAPDAPQGFGRFLRERLFDRVPLGRIEYLDGQHHDALSECARYAALLAQAPIDIVCAGIGENGHMAFNDPHVADFDDPLLVKPVTLDEVCRLQQVHDRAFEALEQVPQTAITLTMSALLAADRIFCVVPGAAKAAAVARTCLGEISPACPASALRRHAQALLYLDHEAAAQI